MTCLHSSKSPAIALFFALSLSATASWAAFVLVAPTPDVRFLAQGPGGMRIEGTTPDFSISEDANAVSFTVHLDTLDTGISLRNKHMKETYLETDKYPVATLAILRSALEFSGPQTLHEHAGEGTLMLHGVTKTWGFVYSAERREGHMTVHATGNVKLGDYHIETPKYLGVGVKPDIGIDVTFTLEDK